ncbi:MAG: agmatinase [Candidatus Omnitrophota bacterium]
MKEYTGFAGLDREFTDWNNSKIAILPVPYDKTSTWVKGADKGPLALIEASSAVELYDIETDSEVYKQGIHTLPLLKTKKAPKGMIEDVEREVSKIIDAGKFTVVLGGEHSVSVGSIKAHCSKYENISVLQLDAHSDLRGEYEGSRYSHACVMARVGEMCPAVQVGIRSMCAEEKARLNPDNTFFAKDIVNSEEWINRVLDKLSLNVYVTIDLDVFDPSIMPSTGTPEPGGLTWYPVLKLLRSVAETKHVVGFDVVELCPNGSNKAPDFLAAKLVYKFLSYVFK